MKETLEKLCHFGSIQINHLGDKGYGVVFDPVEGSKLPEHMQTTIFIERQDLDEAVADLAAYLKANSHWTTYPESYFSLPGA